VRTASALNHPDICTIYAVENADGQSFIAMELLEGQNLDQRLGSGPLPLDRLLDVGIQLADALDAALEEHHSSQYQTGKCFPHAARAGKDSRDAPQ
jgi:non-specific serine/threonine protein kinase